MDMTREELHVIIAALQNHRAYLEEIWVKSKETLLAELRFVDEVEEKVWKEIEKADYAAVQYTEKEERCAEEARRIFAQLEPVEGRDYTLMPKPTITG